MLYITCPWCGPREETEFRYGGEANRIPPSPDSTISDEEWADYLYMRSNPKGWHLERWCHDAGCRRWFNVLRHTVSHRIAGSFRYDETPPDPEEAMTRPAAEEDRT